MPPGLARLKVSQPGPPPSRPLLCTFSSSLSNPSNSPRASRVSAPRALAKDPVDDYYALLLQQPLPVKVPAEKPRVALAKGASPTAAASEQQSPLPAEGETEKARRASIIFGSKLSGAAAHHAVAMAREEQKRRGEGEWVGSTWVPPRPEEPDNCCMSGCVNCVWDGYRDELEGWALIRASAYEEDRKARVRRAEEASGSMDDDGGGSEALWSNATNTSDDVLFQGVPIGIREFMKSEKRLREEKKRREEKRASESDGVQVST